MLGIVCFELLLTMTMAQPDDRISVGGFGATFPSEVYSAMGPAFQSHRQDYVEIDFTYQLENSIGGKQAMFPQDPTVSFGGSEIDLRPIEYATHPELKVVPMLAG